MAHTIQIKVLFFSTLRNITGTDEIVRQFEGTMPFTIADLLIQLYDEYPGLSEWDAQILIAADLDYVDRTHILQDQQEIAIMPPVQGG